MAEVKVEYNFLGKSGIKVSNICLGTSTFAQHKKWIFSTPRQPPEELAHQIMDVYASYGGNFIDTANNYGGGTTEVVVGDWLSKQDRKRFVVATKVRAVTDLTNVNSVGLSRRQIVESLETSLERLKTHYVDLFQSHIWDAATPLDETLRTFDDLIRCGKVRYYGASNLCGWQLQKTVGRLEAMGLNSCVSLQINTRGSASRVDLSIHNRFEKYDPAISHNVQQYNLMSRQSELEEFTVCHNEGIAVLPWAPLKGGLLTGKYKRGETTLDPTATRLGHGQSKNIIQEFFPDWSKYADDDIYWKLMDTLAEIAAAHGKSVAQVAIRWLLQKNFVSSVVLGTTSVNQLEENMGAATGWKLSDEEMKRLDDTSVRYDPYPYPYIWKKNTERLNPHIGAYDSMPCYM